MPYVIKSSTFSKHLKTDRRVFKDQVQRQQTVLRVFFFSKIQIPQQSFPHTPELTLTPRPSLPRSSPVSSAWLESGWAPTTPRTRGPRPSRLLTPPSIPPCPSPPAPSCRTPGSRASGRSHPEVADPSTPRGQDGPWRCSVCFSRSHMQMTQGPRLRSCSAASTAPPTAHHITLHIPVGWCFVLE